MRPVERAGTGLKRSRRRAAEQLQRRAKHAGQTRGSNLARSGRHSSSRATSSHPAPSSRQQPPQPACRRCNIAAAGKAIGSGPAHAAAQKPSSSAAMETKFTGRKCSSPGSCALSKLLRGAQRRCQQLVILRAKVSWIGWACGEGERTFLRQIDHGEDDGVALRVDFARLRCVLGACETPTPDCEKKWRKEQVHDNL